MSIAKEKTQALIKEYAQSDNDTGSVEVQCALLTETIKSLTVHLEGNNHDFQARRSLIMSVSKRRKLLRYLERTAKSRYQNLIKRLGIRK